MLLNVFDDGSRRFLISRIRQLVKRWLALCALLPLRSMFSMFSLLLARFGFFAGNKREKFAQQRKIRINRDDCGVETLDSHAPPVLMHTYSTGDW
jgi:hypothetical protein